jgi:hypothetical protein
MKTLVQVITYLLLVYGLALLASCGTKAQKVDTHVGTPYHWRAQVMENNSVVPVYMTLDQRLTYKEQDSVWVDLSSHMIDDTAQNTMLCRLIECHLTY